MRSRSAANLLVNQGFDATSLEGGMDGWNGLESTAQVDQGMYLLAGDETPEQVLALAYALEEGNRRFYASLAEHSDNLQSQRLFGTLAAAEEQHEGRLWRAFEALTDGRTSRASFESDLAVRAVEGGRTADQVLAGRDPGSLTAEKALGLAMALETDALDLYLRLARVFDGPVVHRVFLDLAEEERAHLKRLGGLRGDLAV